MKQINVKGTARAAFGKKAAREIRKLTPYPVTCMEKQKTKTVHQSHCPSP